MYVDVHCHLYELDAESVVPRAREEGLSLILTNAEDVETARQCVELAERYDIVRAAVGIHPAYAADAKEDDVLSVLRLTDHPKVVAIGEIGLDYRVEKDPARIARQRDVFERFLREARERDLPVIVHSRAAQEDVVETLIRWEGKAVLHWFSGSIELAAKAVDAGTYFSLGPAILRYKSYDALVDLIPLDLLLFETDAPVHFGGEPAMPWWVKRVAERVAEVKRTSVDRVVRKAYVNAKKLGFLG